MFRAMEFSDTKIKKFLYIFWEKEFSIPNLKKLFIFQERTFKAKKVPSEKVSYISGNGPKLEKLLYFAQKIFFLYFRSELAEPEKQKKIRFDEIYYIYPKNIFLYFRGQLAKLEKQKFLLFQEMEFSSTKSKKILIFF